MNSGCQGVLPRSSRARETGREKRRGPALPGLTYASYRLDDGVSFVHVASIEDPDNNPLRQLAAFQTFTAGIKDRCDEPPVTSVLQQIGSYAAK